MTFETPYVCHKHAMLVYPTLDTERQTEWGLLEGELARGEITQKVKVIVLLAHLSRRLMGELIVYQSLRCPSVRPSSVRQHFQTSSPLKPLGQSNSNFIWRLLRTRERKFVQMVLVT